jgi:hypothetical protein
VSRPVQRTGVISSHAILGGFEVFGTHNDFSGGDLRLDGIEKADELLMPMTLHVAADHRPVHDVQRGKERPSLHVGCNRGSASAIEVEKPRYRSRPRRVLLG